MMKSIILLLQLSVVLVACTKGGVRHIDSPAQRDMDALTALLRSGSVRKVEIVGIPRRIITSTRITPAELANQYWYKIEIPDIRSMRNYDQLLKSVAVASTEPADLRFGIIFYDSSGVRGAVYFDKTGRRGFVNSRPVQIDGEMFSWLTQQIKCFE